MEEQAEEESTTDDESVEPAPRHLKSMKARKPVGPGPAVPENVPEPSSGSRGQAACPQGLPAAEIEAATEKEESSKRFAFKD